MRYAGSAAAVLAAGYARLRLEGPERETLATLRAAAAAFFAHGDGWKRAHGDGLYGYRPCGTQFPGNPVRPDDSESFAYWADRPKLIPGYEDLADLTSALSDYWRIAAEVTSYILAEFAIHYRYPDLLETQRSSRVEINRHLQPADRELIQARHEDGHLITLATANKSGLEIEAGGQMRPEAGDGYDMVIMPGSLLTSMTGGDIPPLYHQVRNCQRPGGLTILYLVSSPFRGNVAPYVRNDSNNDVNMASLALEKCEQPAGLLL